MQRGLIAAFVALGGFFTWAPLSIYFERGHRSNLVMAAGYALFTLFLCISVYMRSPANRDRFSRKQMIAAKVAPWLGLGIVGVALWLRRS